MVAHVGAVSVALDAVASDLLLCFLGRTTTTEIVDDHIGPFLGQLLRNAEAYPLGAAGDKPVVGDWDGDGQDEVAVYRDGKPVELEASVDRPDTAVR